MGTLHADVNRLFHLDAEALRCPYPLFSQLREEAPVTYFPDIECYLVTRYDDIVHINRHPQLFSSVMPTGPVLARQQIETLQTLLADDPAFAARLATQRGGTVRVLLNADPPDHARQRKLVNRAFTPP